MFKKILVRNLIIEGAQLLEGLRRNRFPMVAALWSYFSEPMEWRLVIVSPAVDRQGPLAAYSRVQRVLSGTNPSQLTLSDIALISPNSADYEDLRRILPRAGRFSASPEPKYTLEAIFDDTYVYPMGALQRKNRISA